MVSKTRITQFLKAKKQFDVTDSLLINELVYNQKLLKEAKKLLLNNGELEILTNLAADPGEKSMQLNQAIGAYNSALNNILKISGRLGLSPYDRKKIGITGEPESDGFRE